MNRYEERPPITTLAEVDQALLAMQNISNFGSDDRVLEILAVLAAEVTKLKGRHK